MLPAASSTRAAGAAAIRRRATIMKSMIVRRQIHQFPESIKVAPEVQDAVRAGAPVVALESTILTHGIPYPHNLELAHELNALAKSKGVVPATIALMNGVPTVGATDADLETLCKNDRGKEFIKVSRRDIAYCVARGITGGTTIAGTMILAHLAGIKVFATGGLGGVHRGAETTFDVSADLEELGRTPVAVVSSGAKAILDLDKTFEYLETKGVHVSTFGPKGTNLPAFYSRDSGIPSPFNFETPQDAAAVIHASNLLKLESGFLFCVPAPHEFHIPAEIIDAAINEAVVQANEANIKGKEITPFLLNRVFEITNGRSLQSNIGFVKNNFTIAAGIAKALSEGEKKTSLSTPTWSGSNPTSPFATLSPTTSSSSSLVSPSFVSVLPTRTPTHLSGPADCLVIGAIAVDLTCDLPHASAHDASSYIHTSNPGKIHRTPGGVGFNVFLAASYASSLRSSRIRMVSAVGPEARAGIKHALNISDPHDELDLAGVLINPDAVTAQYVAMHDASGELILACGDMNVIENLSPSHIRQQVLQNQSSLKWVALDANLEFEPMTAVIETARQVNANILFEPTAVLKSRTLLDVLARVSSTQAKHQSPAGLPLGKPLIDVITPNKFELAGMFKHARDLGLFDTAAWWQTIDRLQATSEFRNKVLMFSQINRITDLVAEQGLVQQAVHLLPYMSNIFIKLGDKGVLGVQLIESSSFTSLLLSHTSASSVVWHGDAELSIVVRYFPAFQVSDIVSVTGAGDSFCGVMLAELVAASVHDHNNNVLTDFDAVTKIVEKSQRASGLTLKSRLAVNPEIKNL
ncbi:Indigoidine synthase A like protein-domain-containing protein [Lipomyces japonicus]|uniref:Indigoidine synthase A like protein-domain-containing protein n=1 Tax=Lipomyces japonicus TaxID=56871 RepID=UPI0034CD732B